MKHGQSQRADHPWYYRRAWRTSSAQAHSLKKNGDPMPIEAVDVIAPRITLMHVKRLADALVKHAGDNGRPCAIHNAELKRAYDVPVHNMSRIGHNTFAMRELHRQLGGRKWGAAPTYDRGRWVLA